MKKLLLLLVSCFSTQEDRSIIVNVSEDFAFPLGQEVFSDLVSELYVDVPVTVEVTYLPARRGLLLLNADEIEADLYKSKNVLEPYSNLLVLEEPLMEIRVAIFCLERSNCVLNKDTIYLVPRGLESAMQYCLESSLTCAYVSSDHAFKALEQNKGDALFMDMAGATRFLCGYSFPKIYYLEMSELSTEVYHVVSKSMEEYVPMLTQSIVTVNRTGYVEKSIGAFWNEFYGCTSSIPINVNSEYQQLLENLNGTDATKR